MLARRWCLWVVCGVGLLCGIHSAAWAETEKEKEARDKMIKEKAQQDELFDVDFMKVYREAQIKFIQQSYDQVIGMTQNLLRMRKSARAMFLMATAYKAKGLYPRAIDLFQQAAGTFDDKSQFYEKAQSLYNVAFCYELAKNRAQAISGWQLYINFANNYPQESASVAFARARIELLNSIKDKAP